MCLYPKLIKNRKYTSTKKNGGNIPPITDERVKWVPIGCTRCIECKKQKSRAWQVRLHEEIRHDNTGQFVTLTFSNESIQHINKQSITRTVKDGEKEYIIKLPIADLEGYEKDNAIATWAVRHFLERWRKKYKKSAKHWLITELGHEGTENIHLHGIIWTTQWQDIKTIWQYGFVWSGYNEYGKRINYVTEQTINYITKYVTKTDQKHKCYNSQILTSKGIGGNYTNRKDAKTNTYNGKHTKEHYTTRQGYKLNLPIYYRNKIYTEEQREKLWLIKLDKHERWICGEKISIKKNYDAYDALLKWYRKKNAELNYGTDEKNWNREVYERERRKLIQQTRLMTIKTPSAGSIQKGMD